MGKAFNFSLQRVLDVREIMEDKKAMILQKAQAETQLEKQKLASIEAEKERIAHPEAEEEVVEDVTLQSLSNRAAYLDQLNDKIENQQGQVTKKEDQAQVKRDDYIQASKEKMVLEKLKENHHETFRKKSNQTQMKEEGEVASRIRRNGDSA